MVFTPLLRRLQTVVILLTAALLLTGCVEYDVGINYYSQTGGEIVQRVRLGEQLTSFSGAVAENWLSSLEQRTHSLGGRSQRLSQEELAITIPFNNGKDLEKKFNQFFHPIAPAETPAAQTDETTRLPELDSRIRVRESNWLLVQRNRLVFDLDLQDLSVLSSEGSVLINPGSLLTLEFRLNTPWGARRVGQAGLQPEVSQNGKQLVWRLTAGEKNHLEAAFWVPSPLGIGTAGIVALVAIGSLLKSFQSSQRTGTSGSVSF